MSTTIKQLAGNQRRSLASVQKKLMAMSAEWSELDNGTMWMLQDIADKIELAADEMQELAK